MFKIKKETLQAVLDYLSRQPFADVFKLINEIQQCAEIKEDPKP